jgi:hypothetical protein
MARFVPRRRRLLLLASAVVVFLLISALLARVLSANGAERDAVVKALNAQARGDAGAVRRQLSGCAAGSPCETKLNAVVARVRRPGRVLVLSYDAASGFSLGGTSGIARVAWRTSTQIKPVVQCVSVRRTGNPVGGLGIELTALSAPIGNETSCPGKQEAL